LNTEILPALWSGKVVVADQFLYTAVARDSGAWVDLNWGVERLPAALLARPGLLLRAVRRGCFRARPAKMPSFYAARQDVTNIKDAKKSHLQFLGRVIQEYDALSTIFQFLKVDARQTIWEQHREIRQMFMTAKRRSWGEWNTERCWRG